MSATPDPVAEARRLDTERDHRRAAARGERIRALADALLTALDGQGIVLNRAQVRPALFHVLADDIYGNAAIDIP